LRAENIYIERTLERYRSGRNGVDSKSTCPVKSGARGFESHPLRQSPSGGKSKIYRMDIKSSHNCFKRIYGEMSELAEGARLEIACTTKVVPRVRIPLSPPFTGSEVFRRLDGDVPIAPFI
jgi:hypothetical protein